MKHGGINRERPLVLFSITNGWGVRNFVYTGLLDAVSHYADIGVATSGDLLPFFQGMQAQGRIALTTKLPSEEPVFWRGIRKAKKAILQAGCGISTARIKWHERARGPLSRACLAVAWSLQQMLAARWQIRALESLELKFASVNVAQRLKRPSVMVNCSPFDFRDNRLLRALHREGVPTIAIILSWDNPSTKGCISTCVDLVLAWGSKQKEELLQFYPDFDPERIRITGIPQFDAYYQKLSGAFSREPFLNRLSINPARKVILYATCSERLFSTEPEVVTDVVEALDCGRFGNNAHLLIRCHPADRAARYEHLCSTGRVTIFPSSMNNNQNLFSWMPPKDETAVLAATLKHCEVCINTASTMTLDAFACGKPVVNVAYDGVKALPYLRSVRRYYDYHHYLPITRSGAVPIAHSSDELFSSIEEALTKPEKLQSKREAVTNAYCFHPEEGSVDVIAKEIERMAQ